MAGDRPEAIDPHPAGAVTIVEGSQGCDFLGFREEWTRSGQGKKVATGCCGGKSEAAL